MRTTGTTVSSVSRFQIIRENLHPFDVITLAFLKEELPNLPTGRFSNGKISRDMAKTHKRTYKKRSWCKACAYAKRLNTNLCDETLKHPACTVGWVVQLCHSWLSRGRQPEFPIGEIPLGQYSCKKKKLSLFSLKTIDLFGSIIILHDRYTQGDCTRQITIRLMYNSQNDTSPIARLTELSVCFVICCLPTVENCRLFNSGI